MLFGIEPSDLSGPLVQFQATSFSKDEVLKLVRTINQQLGASALEARTLEAVVEKWWPDLDARVQAVLKDSPAPKDANLRTEREILEEVLQISRAMYNRSRASTAHESGVRARNSSLRDSLSIIKAFVEYGAYLESTVTSSEQLDQYLSLAIPLGDFLLGTQGDSVSRSTANSLLNSMVTLQKKREELEDDIPF